MKVTQIDLKSNMDRFIEYMYVLVFLFCLYLKSNMDRFIVCTVSVFRPQKLQI